MSFAERLSLYHRVLYRRFLIFLVWLLTKGYIVRRVLRRESWTLVWIQDEQGHPRAGGTRVVIDILQGRKGRGKKNPFWIWELGGRVAKRVHSIIGSLQSCYIFSAGTKLILTRQVIPSAPAGDGWLVARDRFLSPFFMRRALNVFFIFLTIFPGPSLLVS